MASPITLRQVLPDEYVWFGKYKGRKISDIIVSDPDYIEWCLERGLFLLGEANARSLSNHGVRCAMIGLSVIENSNWDWKNGD